jgi:flavin-dependent dehydrogenase
MNAGNEFDVVIVGGGPAGSTVGTLLRKYNPNLSVLILEKEHFPRPHIGESQLPAISFVLDEMGVWDKVEAAGFPIKLGASFTWGKDDESWDLDFYPAEHFKHEPRPAKYQGQRQYTAFQVDRPRYDEILLRNAESMGVSVREGTLVREVLREGDRITGLRLDDGDVVTGRHYVDATGAVGLIRRAMGVESDAPKELRNIAIWDYWENAEWAIEIGVGGTRIQVRSLPYGWIWFIPIGETRTSIGLVCPSEYYKQSGLTPAELYDKAVRTHPQLTELLAKATPSGNVETTKDWSHLAQRLVGENWFLVGEAAGFADPILSAGMTLAHSSGRDAAYTILEIERAKIDAAWLRRRYDDQNRRSIKYHIRFARYWYASNGRFTDLKEHCRKIAREDGLTLTPKQAWEWLARGGFSTMGVESAQVGSFDLFCALKLVDKFMGSSSEYTYLKYNHYKLELNGATKDALGMLRDGGITPVPCYRRANRILPLAGAYANIVRALHLSPDAITLLQTLRRSVETQVDAAHRDRVLSDHFQALEAMLVEGWVTGKKKPGRPMIKVTDDGTSYFRSTADGEEALRKAEETRAKAEPRPSGSG